MSSEIEPLIIREPNPGPPRHTQRVIYCFMVIFGLASLLPWNMVITAKGYFEYKFHDTNSTTIETSFPRYFQIGGIVTNVALSLTTMSVLKYVKIPAVNILANTMMMVIFIVMTILAKLNTSSWPMAFFGTTNVIFFISCGFAASYISAMVATASMITPNAIQAFYLGQGMAGLFTTTLSIITLSIPGADPVEAGFYYFLIASITLVCSLVAYLLFCNMDYIIASTDRAKTSQEDASEKDTSTAIQLFAKVRKYCATSLITLLVTLACFPAALSALTSSSTDTETAWAKTYFLPVITFLLFNIGDVLGRATSSFVAFPSKKYIFPASIARVVFIPLIYMCNLQPRSINVWFSSDVWPAIFNFFMAWSNGHILSLAASYAPQVIESKSGKSMIGTFSAFASALGLVIGSLLVFPMLSLLQL